MGLLDHLPNGLLELMLRNRNSNAALEPDNAQSSQRLPLSFAGPEPATSRGSGSSADPAPPQLADHPSAILPTQTPTTPNLTAQVLRLKGVPEADITAGMKDPDVMRQILIQHYAPGSRGAPAFPGQDPGIRVQLNGAPQDPSSLIQPVGLRCDGFSAGCQNGGTYGANANYTVSGRSLCRDCAIKILGIENEPLAEQMRILRNFEKK